ETLKMIYQKDKERYQAFLKSPEFKLRLIPVKLSYDFTKIKNPLFHEAFTLLSLGEIREGYKVFLRYLATIQSSRLHHALVISKMFYDMKLFQFSIRYSDFLAGYLNGPRGSNYLSPALRGSSYPLYFKDQVFSLAGRYQMDPYIILAVIREESRFFAGARSFSGAMGLMQLMPGTARELLPRKKKGLGNFYDERLNIALGTKYFAQLLRDMPLSLAVAGYNGGPNRVKRLYKKARKKVRLINIEHFIELIKIDETRNYVKKVLTSYYNYKEIYD
ncbi:MAG TPA: lytic transglycosylase domain-containing protein, partial [Spirochaetes bacterium]|nr:lytic transglycosylase domain-containing protein [Spirochaetota bacterium]